FWAYQEGYLDLDAMFGRGGTPVVTAAATAPAVTPDSTGPGNTETPPAATEPATQLKADDRLVAATTPSAAETSTQPLALTSPAGEAKIEERLGSAAVSAPATAEQAV